MLPPSQIGAGEASEGEPMLTPQSRLVAVHPALWEMVRERVGPTGTYVGVAMTLVDRAPAPIALDCATSRTAYAVPGDTVMLAASDPTLARHALAAGPEYDCRLRISATEVDAPLAQAVADSGGLGLAVIGRDLTDEAVFAGANALIAVLGGVLSRSGG